MHNVIVFIAGALIGFVATMAGVYRALWSGPSRRRRTEGL